MVAATALTALATSSIASADALAKSAKNAGLSADAYQELSEVFRIGGSSAETLTKANQKLMKGIRDLGLGLSTQVDAFDELGLTYQELRDLSPEKQFLLVRDSLSQLTNETDKSAIAQQLFGKAGKEMADILMLTNEEIEAQGDRLRDLGGIIDQELLPIAEKITDEFTTASTVIKSQFTTALLEAIEVGVDLDDMGPMIKSIGEAVHDAATAVFDFIQIIWDWKDVIAQVLAVWLSLRVVMFSTAAIQTIISVSGAIMTVVVSIRAMNVAMLASRAIMVGTIALVVAIPAAIGVMVVAINGAWSDIMEGLDHAMTYVVTKLTIMIEDVKYAFLKIEQFFIGIGLTIQEYLIDAFNDFLGIINNALKFFDKEQIELIGQDATDESVKRLKEVEDELDVIIDKQKQLAIDSDLAVLALAASAGAAAEAGAEAVLGIISEIENALGFSSTAEGSSDTGGFSSVDSGQLDPAVVATEKAKEDVATFWETMEKSWLEYGENALEPIGDQLSDNLSRTLAESISEGDFSGIGDAFLLSIQETLQSQVADKLEDLFTVFFDYFFNAIGVAMSKNRGGNGKNGKALAGASLIMHDGGLVPGQRGADVPIVAQAGEMVLTRDQQRSLLKGETGGDNVPITINMSSVGDVTEATKRANREMADELADMIQTTLIERGALS